MKLRADSKKKGVSALDSARTLTLRAEDDEEAEFLGSLMAALIRGPSGKVVECAKRLASEFRGQPNEFGRHRRG